MTTSISMPLQNDISPKDMQLILKACQQISQRYFGGRANIHDFIGAAWVGLKQAKEKFDEKLGFKFTTLAFRHMHGRILDQLREEGYRTRVMQTIWENYQKLVQSGTDRHEAVERVLEGRQRATCLAFYALLEAEDPVFCRDWSAASYPSIDEVDHIADPIDPMRDMLRNELKDELHALLDGDALSPDETRLIKAVFFSQLTVQQIANYHFVPVSDVRDQLDLALGKLRAALVRARKARLAPKAEVAAAQAPRPAHSHTSKPPASMKDAAVCKILSLRGTRHLTPTGCVFHAA